MLHSTAPPSAQSLRSSYAFRLYTAESEVLVTPDSPASAGTHLSTLSSASGRPGTEARRRSHRVSGGEYDVDRSVRRGATHIRSPCCRSALIRARHSRTTHADCTALCLCVPGRVSHHHSSTMLRLEVDAPSPAAASHPPSSSSAVDESVHSSSAASLPSMNDLYRQQLLGLQPAHSSRRSFTSTSTLASTVTAPPVSSLPLSPVATHHAASNTATLSFRHSLSSPTDRSVPSSTRISLSSARSSHSRPSIDVPPAAVGRQSLSSPLRTVSAVAMGAPPSSAVRAARTSLGQHSSAHKLALNPSTAQHIAKHQSQTTNLRTQRNDKNIAGSLTAVADANSCLLLRCVIAAELVASPAASDVSFAPSLLHSSLPFSPSATSKAYPSPFAVSAASDSRTGQENANPNIPQLADSLSALTLDGKASSSSKARRDMQLLSPPPPYVLRPAGGNRTEAGERRRVRALFPARTLPATPRPSTATRTPRTPAVMSPATSASSASSNGSGSIAGSSSMRRRAESGRTSVRSAVSAMR